MIPIIIAQISWIILALLCGFIEAHYYDLVYTYGNKKHKNLHPFYFALRGIFLLGITFGLGYTLEWWQCVVFMFASALTFSFFHNGMYCITRHFFTPEKYVNGWWSDKEQGTDENKAEMEFNAGMRTMMAIVGIAFIIGLIFELQ